MPRTTRNQLLELARQALEDIDRLDVYLYDMSRRAKGRQPAIDEMASILIEGHQQLRVLWSTLKSRL